MCPYTESFLFVCFVLHFVRVKPFFFPSSLSLFFFLLTTSFLRFLHFSPLPQFFSTVFLLTLPSFVLLLLIPSPLLYRSPFPPPQILSLPSSVFFFLSFLWLSLLFIIFSSLIFSLLLLFSYLIIPSNKTSYDLFTLSPHIHTYIYIHMYICIYLCIKN